MAQEIEKIWPEWKVERRIGGGAYGTVYQAVRTDHNLTSRAAIKVISIPKDPDEIQSLQLDGMTADGTRTYLQGIVEDFVNEIQLMESLKGVQNIVSVEDYKVVERKDEIGWDIYIRMELLKGKLWQGIRGRTEGCFRDSVHRSTQGHHGAHVGGRTGRPAGQRHGSGQRIDLFPQLCGGPEPGNRSDEPPERPQQHRELRGPRHPAPRGRDGLGYAHPNGAADPHHHLPESK